MGLEFLVRVRRVSLVATAVAALLAANYAAPRAGLGLAAGALWSLVNLFLVQALVVTLTTPGARPWPRAVLARAYPDAGWARFLHEFEAVIFAIAIALVLCVVAFLATRRPQMIPGRLQNLVETLVESLRDFVIGILGPEHGPRYVPFLGSLFIYILAMNLLGLIPFMDSPTSNLNVTVSLALVVFVYAQYVGFTELGFIGYFDHMMGSPRTLIGWVLVPLMLPIHLMGELAKPIS